MNPTAHGSSVARSGRGRRRHARAGRFLAPSLLCLLLVACGGGGTPDAATGTASVAEGAPAARSQDTAATLAYEHTLGIALEADAIPARVAAVRAACEEARFGACTVLHVRQQGGDRPSGSVGMRIVPEGVEPMIGLASDGAERGTRNTHAEDLAVPMRDNALARQRLKRELARLEEFQARPDLAVADVIALSERMAAVEASLEAVDRDAAQHRRRIDMQRLTVDIDATAAQGARLEVVRAFRDFGSILATGTAWTIRATAFLLPLLLVALVVTALLRRRRRPG